VSASSSKRASSRPDGGRAARSTASARLQIFRSDSAIVGRLKIQRDF
jgi:hypothetical protein